MHVTLKSDRISFNLSIILNHAKMRVGGCLSGRKFIKITCRKLRTEESEQNRTEINEGGSFVYLVLFWFLDRVILLALEFYLL